MFNSDYYKTILKDIKDNINDVAFIKNIIHMLVSTIDYKIDDQKISIISIDYIDKTHAFIIRLKLPDNFLYIKDDVNNEIEEISQNIKILLEIVCSYLNALLPKYIFLFIRVFD